MGSLVSAKAHFACFCVILLLLSTTCRADAPAKAQKIRQVHEAKLIDVSFALRLQNEDKLDEFLSKVYSPENRAGNVKFLTADEFRDQFCPTADQVQEVVTFLEDNSLEVTKISSNNMIINARGTAQQMNQALNIELNEYEDEDGGAMFMATEADSLASSLPSVVASVVGLDTRETRKPSFTHSHGVQVLQHSLGDLADNFDATETILDLRNLHAPNDKRRRLEADVAERKQQEKLKTTARSRPDITLDDLETKYDFLTPRKVRDVYHFSQKNLGTNQTVAIIAFDNVDFADIVTYVTFFNISANTVVEKILLPDTCSKCCTGRRHGKACVGGKWVRCNCKSARIKPGKGSVEVALDVELMISQAPHVERIQLYIAPNSNKGSLELYNQIAIDNLASVVSTSWGASEGAIKPDMLLAHQNVFKQFAAQGQSHYCASGDSGAFDNHKGPSVDDPASQPFVTGVGGTSLSLAKNGSSITYSESTWWEKKRKEGGGGGISKFWSLPSYQNFTKTSSSKASNTYRNVPDVSIMGDPNHVGYPIVWNQKIYIVGGTSCGAPLWSAFTVVANEMRALKGKGRLGFSNPILYELAQGPHYDLIFRDVKDGSTNGKYPATPGYDLGTGLGTPIVDNLLIALQGCDLGQSITAVRSSLICA